MHELSVTQNLLDIVLQHAEDHDARQISVIHLVIGQLASIVDDCVQFYWDIISADTIAQGATLDFRRIPAQLRCDSCQQSYPLRGDDWTCPYCGASAAHLVAGEEFYVESIEVEQ